MTDVPIEIARFRPLEADPAAWAAWHAFRRERATAVDPDDPLLNDQETEIEQKRSDPLWDYHWFVAWVSQAGAGRSIVGTASFGFRRPETEGAAPHAPFLGGGGYVLPAWRRRGIGRRLLEEAGAMMVAMDKTTLSLTAHHPDGHAFLLGAGAVEKHRHIQNRALFEQLDWAQLRLWEDSISQLGLVWERHAGRVPEDRLSALLPDFTRLIEDIPMGGLDRPPIRFRIEGYRHWYETLERVGGAHHVLALRDPDGHVVGLTETAWDARVPDRVWQQLTATDRAWRGKGVARALKAAMFRQIREHHSDVRLMITDNAEVNAPMLSINNRVGFKVYRNFVDYQVSKQPFFEKKDQKTSYP